MASAKVPPPVPKVESILWYNTLDCSPKKSGDYLVLTTKYIRQGEQAVKQAYWSRVDFDWTFKTDGGFGDNSDHGVTHWAHMPTGPK